MRQGTWLLLLAALASCDGSAGPGAPPTDAQEQRLAEECCAAATARLEAYLGKKFKAPVPVEMKTREEAAALMRELMEAEVPMDLVEEWQRISERLHLVPEGYDLFAMQVVMYGRVAGFYDPAADRFYVVRGVSPADSLEFRTTVAHELVHAYRDVDKDYWARGRRLFRTHADEAQALQFLVEGDATLLGYAVGYAAEGAAVDPMMVSMVERPDAALEEALRDPTFADFPLVLREPLLAPYIEGLVFAGAIFRSGGKEALDRAFDRPPRSTEQVLHPAKYLGKPDEPREFEGGDPTSALGDGWRLRFTGVMGEFDVRLLFAEKLGRMRARVAAAGWDGARYWYCEKAGLPAFFGMATVWDARVDAREFAHAWADWALRRDGNDHGAGGHGEEWRVGTKEGLVVVRLEEDRVYVADGVPPDRVEAVLAAMASARAVERKAG